MKINVIKIIMSIIKKNKQNKNHNKNKNEVKMASKKDDRDRYNSRSAMFV